jgi:hypothetical protein
MNYCLGKLKKLLFFCPKINSSRQMDGIWLEGLPLLSKLKQGGRMTWIFLQPAMILMRK